METTAPSKPVAGKSQADQIHDLQVRRQRRFRTNVAVSWLIMLALLLFLFSGINVNIGPLHLQTDRKSVV